MFLLLAALLMILVCFVTPVGYADSSALFITSFLPLLILNLLVGLLLLVDIFLFKALKFQMKMVRVCIVLILCSAVIGAFILYSQVGTMEPTPLIAAIMLGCALVFSALALQGMKSDYKKLHSYDRLR